MSILADHYGGFSPARPAIWNSRDFRLGFVGKPSDHACRPNPGSPNNQRDPGYVNRLIEMFGNDRHIIYIIGDHSGLIGFHDGGLLTTIKHWSPNHRVMSMLGDACIIHHGQLQQPHTFVLRTWDCGNFIITNPKLKLASLVHCSINTEFGYGKISFLEPISRRVMKDMGNPADCYVLTGPSIGGISQSRCWCYEFDTIDADVLFCQIANTHPTVPLNGLRRERPADSKTDIAIGELLVRVFESYGLHRHHQIDLTCNICTCCEAGLFYSNRYTRVQLRNGCSEEERLVHEEQMTTGYGNLAFLHFY